MLVVALLAAACGGSARAGGHDLGFQVRVEYPPNSAACRTSGPAVSTVVEPAGARRAGLDVGSDGTVDVLRAGSTVLVRRDAFAGLAAAATDWVRFQVGDSLADDAPFRRSYAGIAAAGLAGTGPSPFERVQRLRDEGRTSPVELGDVLGIDLPGRVAWTVHDGVVTDVQVTYPEPSAESAGQALGMTYSLQKRAPALPAPSAAQITDGAGLPALPLVLDSPPWDPTCALQNPTEERRQAFVDCVRRVVGSRTVAQWETGDRGGELDRADCFR